MAWDASGHPVTSSVLIPSPQMPAFCDVAVPVPLDAHFTYRIDASHPPVLGGRVIVPFRNEKLIGVVTRLHDDPPPVEAKSIEQILDDEAIVSPQLLELARWISQYYLAPLGEVLAHHAAAGGRGAQTCRLPHLRGRRARSAGRRRAGKQPAHTPHSRRTGGRVCRSELPPGWRACKAGHADARHRRHAAS